VPPPYPVHHLNRIADNFKTETSQNILAFEAKNKYGANIAYEINTGTR
jgi:hypothetical protein